MQISYVPTTCKVLFQGVGGAAINITGKTNHCPYPKAKYTAC